MWPENPPLNYSELPFGTGYPPLASVPFVPAGYYVQLLGGGNDPHDRSNSNNDSNLDWYLLPIPPSPPPIIPPSGDNRDDRNQLGGGWDDDDDRNTDQYDEEIAEHEAMLNVVRHTGYASNLPEGFNLDQSGGYFVQDGKIAHMYTFKGTHNTMNHMVPDSNLGALAGKAAAQSSMLSGVLGGVITKSISGLMLTPTGITQLIGVAFGAISLLSAWRKARTRVKDIILNTLLAIPEVASMFRNELSGTNSNPYAFLANPIYLDEMEGIKSGIKAMFDGTSISSEAGTLNWVKESRVSVRGGEDSIFVALFFQMTRAEAEAGDTGDTSQLSGGVVGGLFSLIIGIINLILSPLKALSGGTK